MTDLKETNINKSVSLFEDLTSDNNKEDLQPVDTKFKEKVECWKSFTGDRTEVSKKFEEDFLNHSVIDTTRDREMIEGNDNLSIKKVKRFWEPDSKAISDEIFDTYISESCNKENLPSIADENSINKKNSKIENEQSPSLTESRVQYDNSNSNLYSTAVSIKPELHLEKANTIHSEQEIEINNNNIDNFQSKKMNVSTFPKNSIANDVQVENRLVDKIGNTPCSDGIQEDSLGDESQLNKKQRYMNGTIPVDPTEEIVENLENKIKQLNSQILNYKIALNTKENTIKTLNLQIELLQTEEHNIDSLYIEKFVSKGLKIIEEIKNIEQPRDLSQEITDLRLENLSLKNIIDELALRIIELRNRQELCD